MERYKETLPWRPNDISFDPLWLTLMGVLRPHFWGAIISRKLYVLGVARSICGSLASCYLRMFLRCSMFSIFTKFIFKNVGKWRTHIIKQQINMNFFRYAVRLISVLCRSGATYE